MGRIRYIKPAFHEDIRLAEVSRDVRLLYIGLWNFMDRDGVIEDEPRLIKRNVFPYDDDMTSGVVVELINDLCRIGRLVRVEWNGGSFLWCPTFAEHQKFHPNEKPIYLIPKETLLAAYQQPSSNLPSTINATTSSVGTGTGTGTGTGIGIGTPITCETPTGNVQTGVFNRDELKPCIDAWLGTLKHFKAGEKLGIHDEAAIASAVNRYGIEQVTLALEGVRFQKAGDTYDPAQFLTISNAFTAKNFDRLVRIATAERTKAEEKKAKPRAIAKVEEIEAEEISADPELVKACMAKLKFMRPGA